MQEEEITRFLKQKIFLVLKTNRFYTGEILRVNNHSLLLLDKFNNEVLISLNDISSIEPDRNKEEREW